VVWSGNVIHTRTHTSHMHTLIHTQSYTHAHAHTHTSTHTHTYVHTHINTHIHTHTYTHAYAHTHALTHIHTYTHLHTHTHTQCHTLKHTYTRTYTHMHTYRRIRTSLVEEKKMAICFFGSLGRKKMAILHSQISAVKIDGHVGLRRQSVLGCKPLKLGVCAQENGGIRAFFLEVDFASRIWKKKMALLLGGRFGRKMLNFRPEFGVWGRFWRVKRTLRRLVAFPPTGNSVKTEFCFLSFWKKKMAISHCSLQRRVFRFGEKKMGNIVSYCHFFFRSEKSILPFFFFY